MTSENPRHPDLLLVDDQHEVRDVIENAGKLFGYDIVTIETGQAAIDQFCELSPRFCIIDYQLGDLNGTDVGRKIRELPGGSHTRLILLSGDLSEQIAQEAKEVGFDDVMRKPVSIQGLMDLLGTTNS